MSALPRWVKKLKQRKTGILSSSAVARSGGATTICRTLNLVHRNGYEPIDDWSLTDWAPAAENYHKISNALLRNLNVCESRQYFSFTVGAWVFWLYAFALRRISRLVSRLRGDFLLVE
jgi:hypothetical protein